MDIFSAGAALYKESDSFNAIKNFLQYQLVARKSDKNDDCSVFLMNDIRPPETGLLGTLAYSILTKPEICS